MWDASAAALGSRGVFPRFMPSRRGYRVQIFFLFFFNAVRRGGKKHLSAAQKEDISYVLRGGLEKSTHCVH